MAGATYGNVLIVGDQRGKIQALLQAAGELDHVAHKIEWALFPAASPLLEAPGLVTVCLRGVLKAVVGGSRARIGAYQGIFRGVYSEPWPHAPRP